MLERNIITQPGSPGNGSFIGFSGGIIALKPNPGLNPKTNAAMASTVRPLLNTNPEGEERSHLQTQADNFFCALLAHSVTVLSELVSRS